MKDDKNSEPEEKKEAVPAEPVPSETAENKTPPAAEKEFPEKTEADAASSSLPQKSAGRILLIEDDPPMVKMYSTKLKMEGFEVEVAYDGEEGLKKINESLPGLVVLDLMIPKIGGMDLLEKLRTDAKTKSLPVIILSNLSQEQDIQRAKQLGVKEFIIKANFTPGQVVNKISALLKK